MFEILFKVWWMIAVMPFIIFTEATTRFANFLKKRDIYHYWDVWHSLLLVCIVFLIVLLITGYH